ncbi:MAG: bestrophin family ion channel [Bacteroidota bacterium]
MQIQRNYSLWSLLRWTRKFILIFALMGAVAVALYTGVGYLDIEPTTLTIPWVPMSLVGIALAFFLGFKTNSSYDRQWEARKIYGAIVNSSRSWGMMVIGFVTDLFYQGSMNAEELKAIHKVLILRHVAWLTALRYQLRTPRSWEHTGAEAEASRHWLPVQEYKVPFEEELGKYVSPEELTYLMEKKNRATQILNQQSLHLKQLRALDLIDDFRHVQLENMLVDFFTQQGKCERIKNYPFPRQYATLTNYITWLFILLVPYALLDVFANAPQSVWLTIPFTVLIGWIFHTMERIGDYSENPFEGLHNDIPITALSRTIEIDLLDMLDEENLPPKVEAENDFLM